MNILFKLLGLEKKITEASHIESRVEKKITKIDRDRKAIERSIKKIAHETAHQNKIINDIASYYAISVGGKKRGL